MNMRFLIRLAVMSATLLVVSTATAQENTPAAEGPQGCWALNLSESDLGGRAAPKSETFCISRNTPAALDLTVHVILADGKVHQSSWSGAPDGIPRPLEGSANGERDALRRSGNGLVAENETADGTTIHEDIGFSSDALTMTVKAVTHSAKGETRATYVAHAVTLAYPTAPAVYTDPARAGANPASMTVLHVPSHGVLINGVLYRAAGEGPHPTIVICHGLPGNEKNLDLAQAVRRAGWNAVTFNYRGSWGSPGNFRFAQNLEDADSVLAYLRDPTNATKLGIDTKRIVLAGHSMGGWVTVQTAAHDHALLGAVLISAADMGKMGGMEMAKLSEHMADDMESLAGVTPQSMAEELRKNADLFRFDKATNGLLQTPILVLSADDGLAPNTDALINNIESNGGMKVTAIHVVTDHSWSEHRVALESMVITWIQGLQ